MSCGSELKMWKISYNCTGYKINTDEFYLVDNTTRFNEIMTIPNTQCMYINVIAENNILANNLADNIFYDRLRHSA